MSRKRGQRGSGASTVTYVAKYDYPAVNVVAGQIFTSIDEVPEEITVVPVPKS